MNSIAEIAGLEGQRAMWRAAIGVSLLVLFASSAHSTPSQVSPAPAPTAEQTATAASAAPFAKDAPTFDSPAQGFARKLPQETLKSPGPARFSSGYDANPRSAIVLDEIRVYGRIEPEDYVGPKKPPLLQFRERLENDVPLSPAKKAQLALCFIGLCGIYGPEGIPVDGPIEDRTQARTWMPNY